MSALQLGSTTIGIQTSEGVVLGVEKRVQSPLLESSSIEKIMEIDSHIGCAMSGLTADARTMVDHARVTAQVSLSDWHILRLMTIPQNHTFTYDERIKVESVTQSVGDLAMRFGESTADDEAMMVRWAHKTLDGTDVLPVVSAVWRRAANRRCGRERTTIVRGVAIYCDCFTV